MFNNFLKVYLTTFTFSLGSRGFLRRDIFIFFMYFKFKKKILVTLIGVVLQTQFSDVLESLEHSHLPVKFQNPNNYIKLIKKAIYSP